MRLAGDIGATKTVLAIYDTAGNAKTPIIQKKYPSGNYYSLESIIQQFFDETGQSADTAAFGVAGPVIGGTAELTNLNWIIKKRELKSSFGFKDVALVNDLVATATAIPELGDGDLHQLNSGFADKNAPLAIIAPGTGLGEAYLTWDGTQYQAWPSEGGHADFAPTNEFELGLLNYLYGIYGHVSTERVCSGTGIPNIYNYLKISGKGQEPSWLKEKLVQAADPTPIIIQTALEDPEASILCTRTLETFVSILGAETGNIALRMMATGGVYLGGGIPPRILPMLKSEHFKKSFCNKGRFRDVMSDIPVNVILNAEAALIGAAVIVLGLG